MTSRKGFRMKNVQRHPYTLADSWSTVEAHTHPITQSRHVTSGNTQVGSATDLQTASVGINGIITLSTIPVCVSRRQYSFTTASKRGGMRMKEKDADYY